MMTKANIKEEKTKLYFLINSEEIKITIIAMNEKKTHVNDNSYRVS